MIDESLSAKSEITLTKENPTKISSSNSTTDIEKPSSSISSQLSQFPPSLNSLYLPFTQLFSKNVEFQMITFLFSSWIILTLLEFIYGLSKSDSLIISDGFFNTFKTISFLITCLSFLFTYLTSNTQLFISKRIELIASLTSIIFLVIVSVYMCLQSLHLITEDHMHHVPISFFNFIYVIKVIVDIIALMPFSDYILHPSIQIKINLWKICKEWKDLNEISFTQLKQCSKVLKKWNNHSENLNSLCISLISDLISSISFIVFFYAFDGKKYLDKGYMVISIVNFIFVIIMTKPLFNSVIRIFMQGKCEIYEAFYGKLNKEITYFEGCLGVKDIKFWMNAQNDIKGYIKIYAKKDIDRNKIKEVIHKIADEIDLTCDFTLEISE